MEVPFFAGLTPAGAILAAEMYFDVMTLVMVDGRILSRDALNSEIEDGCEIRVMRLVSGG